MRRHRSRVLPIVWIVCALATGGVIANCSATPEEKTFDETSGGDPGGSGAGAQGGAGGSGSSQGGGGEGGLLVTDAGTDRDLDVFINPCGSACGPDELCDIDHLGLDDDCDGQVDEICECSGSQAHFCFKGDPSYHLTEGCYDGTEKCT
jgi:hypothetical protein